MLIAIERSSFNYIFKYNNMSISLSQILDLSDEILEAEIQIESNFIVSEFDRILPVFELDHELLLLKIQKAELGINGKINVPFNSILKVFPLTCIARNLLLGKLNPSIEISDARFEKIVEKVKLIRAFNNRNLLFKKLTKICCIKENPNEVFSRSVQNTVELLLKGQSVANTYLANLIQYNYNPNEISAGNIEFLQKIGIITWITTQNTSEGYVTSKYFNRCEEFKSKINFGDYATGLKTYFGILENQSTDFKISHDKIKNIINGDPNDIDLFKVSYYFLAIKTQLNKNHSNLLELFESIIRDVYEDSHTMVHVLYLISFSFSFEQLYESIHILEKSSLLKSKFIVRDVQTIFDDFENEKIKLKKEEEERIKIKEENQLKAEAEEQIRLIQEEHLKAETEERIRLEEESQLKAEAEEKNRLEQELKTEEEIEFDAERIKMLIQSHTPVDDRESYSDSNLSENKNEEIEIGKTIELDSFDNSEKVNVQDLKDSDDSTKNENENSGQQESNPELSEPSTEYQNSDNIEVDKHVDKIKDVELKNSDEFSENKQDNSGDINLESSGYKEVESENAEINNTIPIEKPNRGRSTKPKTPKIIQQDEISVSEMKTSNPEDSKSQTSEISTEHTAQAESTLITIQIFEEKFLDPYLSGIYENKEKIKLWTDFMEKKFPNKTEVISFSKLYHLFKYSSFTREAMFESEAEMELLENFFKSYNQ
jgi:hypothetical protein